MTASSLKRRLAIAAPLVQLAVGSTLLALSVRPAALLTPAAVAALVVPALIGVWVFRDRSWLHRVLLGAWAPAGAVVLFFVVLFGMRFLSRGSDVFFWAAVGVPLVLLFVLGVLKLRGQRRRTWVLALVLWAVAIAEAVVAIPVSERFGTVGDMQSLAGTLLLLFAPGIAFGAWGGLALAALVPEEAPATTDAESPLAPSASVDLTPEQGVS